MTSFLFFALQKEAAPLIHALNLKQTDGRIRCFRNEDTILTLTGTGPLSAAAAVSAVLAQNQADETDFLINAGIAAGVAGAEWMRVYRIHKVHDCASERDYYPDLPSDRLFPEAALLTGSALFRKGQHAIHSESPLLYDMEGSAILHAGSMFLPLHRICLLKAVSDSGEVPSDETISRCASLLCDAVLRELERLRSDSSPVPLHSDIPSSLRTLSAELNASVTMERRLNQLLRYCALAGIDPSSVLQQLREAGRLPAASREEGKKILEVLFHELLP